MTTLLVALLLAACLATPAGAATVEGFHHLVAAANHGDYVTNRSVEVPSPSSWEYGQGRTQTVTWETGAVPAGLGDDESVTFVWSCGLSGAPAAHELELDGVRVLIFSSGRHPDPVEWRQDDVVLRFVPVLRDGVGEIHGTKYLTLPRDRVRPGEPLRPTVRGVDGGAWFMLHHFTDSHAFARVSEIDLPSGRQLLVPPPRTFYVPPASISWRAPVRVYPRGPEGATDSIAVAASARRIDAEAPQDDDGLGDALRRTKVRHTEVRIRLPPGAPRVPIDLGTITDPGRWELRVAVCSQTGEHLGSWTGQLVVADLSAFEHAERAARAALDRARAAVAPGSVAADIAVPSVASLLQAARERLEQVTTADRFDSVLVEARTQVTLAQRQAGTLAAGRDPFAGRTGLFTQAYVSDWDGQLQPYVLHVPASYDSTRVWPLVVMLHGFGSSGRIAVQRLFGGSPASAAAFLVAAPEGRGNVGYTHPIGEDGVFRVVADVARTHRVDADRVYLTGLSMGGAGTWHLGLRYPHRFAAIAAVCGHTTWRVGLGAEPDSLTAAVRDELSSLAYAENAQHLPVAIFHGVADPVVSVEHSRLARRRLRELGYRVEYTEYPGVGHNSWDAAYEGGRILEWFGRFRRDPWPRHVVHVTANPRRYGMSYWVRVEGLERSHTQARIEAAVTGANRIRVQADNVSAFGLRLDAPLVDPDRPVVVVADGAVCYDGPVPDGWLSWRLAGGACSRRGEPLPDTAPVYGGVTYPLLDVHAFVYGTTGPPETAQRLRSLAELLAASGRPNYRLAFPVVADTALTDQLARRANLVLIGSPRDNAVLADLLSDLPLQVTNDELAVGSHRAGADEILLLAFPNPRHSQRSLLVVGAVRPETLSGVERIPDGLPEVVILGPDGAPRSTGSFLPDWTVLE